MAAPLKLKRQNSSASVKQNKQITSNLPVAAVLVDTPVSHLEGIYDYLVPVEFDEIAVAGTKVVVPFGNSKCEGLVVTRKNQSAEAKNLKVITEVTSPKAMVTADVMNLVESVRNRFGGSYWAVMKSAIPARIVKEEKTIGAIPSKKQFNYSSSSLIDLMGRADYGMLSGKQRVRWALNLPIGIDPSLFLAELVKVRAVNSQVLIIVPDEKDVSQLQRQLSDFFQDHLLIMGSHLPKAQRYRHFLKATYHSPKVIITTRSGCFLHLSDTATVIVLSDLDNSHYEQHSPGWNTRDVVLLRAVTASVIFVSASHSLEVARLVDLGWLEKKSYRSKCNIKFYSNDSGRSYIPTIKSAINRGNVLVSVSEKGYGNLFLCARCRNTASCSCGGKLQILSANSFPVCYICHNQNKDWRCSYCGDAKPYVIAKGIDRNAEEIGRALPKTSILISSGAKQIQSLPKGRHIVLATAGSEPEGQYSGIVLLDGERIFNRPSLRAEELARLNWFASLCRATENSEVFMSLPNSHPVVQSMLRLDSQSAAISELRNRELAKLPPFYRIAVVLGAGPEISKFAGNLKTSGKYEVTGPIDIDKSQKKIIIRVSLQNGQELVDLLDDVTKVQGVKGKNIFKIRFDPYDL